MVVHEVIKFVTIGKIIHEANEKNQIFEYSSQPSSSLHLHEDNSSN